MEHESTIVLDRAAALERLGFEKEIFDELVQSLVERSRSMVVEIGEALAQGDAGRVETLSHSIKGAAATLEANALALAAQRLEMLARRSDLAEGRVAWIRLSGALDELAAAAH